VKIWTCLAAAILIVGVLAPLPAGACWAYLSAGDLLEQADLIVVGEIQGVSKVTKHNSLWMTNWNVEARYYLKGDPGPRELTVTTPGAENKQPVISIEYRLGQKGDTVLLFLAKRDGLLEPLTPQGVLRLTVRETPLQDTPSGEQLLKKYALREGAAPEEDMVALESYITGLPRVGIPVPGEGRGPAAGLFYATGAALLLLLALAARRWFPKRNS
jgi:hypothetical protein